MHARALSRALTAVAGLALGATLTISPALAGDVDPGAPVVVDDAISLYPGEMGEINVLANDIDPAEPDDLAVCRLPGIDFTHFRRAGVFVQDESQYGGPAGTLMVSTMQGVRGTHEIHYYVCNHTRLSPATLTVTIRPTAPVRVDTVDGRPGKLTVTNQNARKIRFLATDRTGCKVDAHISVPAGGTRTVTVRRHVVEWVAMIGRGGTADHGTVRHIALDGPAAPAGKPNRFCTHGIGGDLSLVGAAG